LALVGAWDSTIIIEAPAVAGITALGIDHVTVPGDTIEQIAWHKSGIFIKDCAASSVEQEKAAAEVLRQPAAEIGAPLQSIGVHPIMSLF